MLDPTYARTDQAAWSGADQVRQARRAPWRKGIEETRTSDDNAEDARGNSSRWYPRLPSRRNGATNVMGRRYRAFTRLQQLEPLGLREPQQGRLKLRRGLRRLQRPPYERFSELE